VKRNDEELWEDRYTWRGNPHIMEMCNEQNENTMMTEAYILWDKDH